jgi:hypothetical protein
MSHSRKLITAMLCAVFALCSATVFAQSRTLSADEKELAAYTLTMANVKKVAAALQLMMAEMEKDPKVREAKKIDADIKALEKKDELTDAESAQLDKLRERKDALEEEVKDSQWGTSGGGNQSLDDMEASIKRHPAAAGILASQGLSPREYAKTIMALLQAAMAEGFSQGKLDLAKLPPGINPENIKFVRENKAALDEIQRAAAGGKKQ